MKYAHTPRLSAGQQACVDQDLQVMRDRWLGQPERFGQVAHAGLAALVERPSRFLAVVACLLHPISLTSFRGNPC